MSRSQTKPVAREVKRFALYVRVSTEQQLEGRTYHSIASQRDFLIGWVASKGGEVFRVYEDTESGTKFDERPGLQALIRDAMAHNFDEAVAYNADRWCRSLDIHAMLKRIERESGIRFASATQEFTATPEGQLLEGQLAVMNQFYSQVIAAKVKLKRQLRADKGEWNGGRRPYGYTSEAGRLLVVAHEADVARRMFELFLEHPSSMSIRRRLRALGITDRQGRPWSSSSIEAILRNPIYVGQVRTPDGNTRPGIHEAIITQELWDRVQAAKPTRTRLMTKIERPFPLAGLMVCGACDTRMTLHYVAKKNGRKIGRYRCTTTFQRGWHECPVKEVNADQIEQWTKDQIARLGAEGALLDDAIAAANAANDQRTEPLRSEQAALLARINETRTKVARLVDAIAEGGAGFASIRAKLTLEERNLRLLEHDLTRIRAEIDRMSGDPIDADRLRRLLGDFDALLAVANAAEREELLKLLIKRIVFRGTDAEVTMELFAGANLPSGGSNFRALWLPKRPLCDCSFRRARGVMLTRWLTPSVQRESCRSKHLKSQGIYHVDSERHGPRGEAQGCVSRTP